MKGIMGKVTLHLFFKKKEKSEKKMCRYVTFLLNYRILRWLGGNILVTPLKKDVTEVTFPNKFLEHKKRRKKCVTCYFPSLIIRFCAQFGCNILVTNKTTKVIPICVRGTF